MLFARFLRSKMKRGTLTIYDHRGERHVVGDGSEPRVTVRFLDPRLGTALVLNPALHAGEAYMNGTLVVEDSDLYGMLDLVLSNLAGSHGHWLMRSLKAAERMVSLIRTYNPMRRARRNVAHHYNLSTALYESFLDPEMQYSMGYFRAPEDTLEQAQRQKMALVAAKLRLAPGQRVLDIGCGWGGLAMYLARHHGVHVTGISLSEEQLKVANARAEREGLTGAVSFRLQDYRELGERFDRIVSVGMFEHVGLPHYAKFFRVIQRCLDDGGVALLHTIGRLDGPGATDAWTNKYIFPGGYSPALSEIVPHVERSGLVMTDIEILRLHYAYTLQEWRRRFLAHRSELLQHFDERFMRMWEFFLATAEGAFRYGHHCNFHIQLARRAEAVPLTRGYLSTAL